MTPEHARRIVIGVLHEVAPQADVRALRDDSDLRRALRWDWFDFVHFARLLSVRSGLRLDGDDLVRLGTLGGAVRWLAPTVIGLPR